MSAPDGPEQRTAELEERFDADFDELLTDDEPADDYYERAAERVDCAEQDRNQDLRDAGRGHLVRP